MSIIGLDPTSGPIPASSGGRAERATSLDGAVLGLVSNGLGRSDDILAALGQEIGRRVKLGGVVQVRKPSVSVPPTPFDWEHLINTVTVAVAGFGG